MGIFINEIGYLPNEKKIAVALYDGKYTLYDSASDKAVKSYEAVYFGKDEVSDDECYKIDFSDVTTQGAYYLANDKNEKSAVFNISASAYSEVIKAMIKCLYFQRCGCGLDEKYAGVYKHDICHTSKAILVEDYLNKVANPKEYEVTGGWHDAGDFGRYISAAAVAVGHILYAYELFPDNFKEQLNIPESGNGVEDVLNEVRYELEWMLKMQAENGGLYHKLTTYNHADFIMPEFDTAQLYIFPISSVSTADFAACMAVASRIYKKYDEVFAKKMMDASIKAYEWLDNNGNVEFHNPENCNTGEYDDSDDRDERFWAAAELFRAFPDNEHYKSDLVNLLKTDISKTDFGWTDVSGFALLTILTDKKHSAGSEIEQELIGVMLKEADRLCDLAANSGYDLFMADKDFVWGSNMVVANRSILLILASMICEDKVKASKYKEIALEAFNYLCGKNALGRSYITGFGEHAYRNPHNRTSACDGIDDPMPGWVSGGPFRTPVDPDAKKVIPEGTAPMKCHADVVGSYSTNEITIYWNSPVIFMTAYFNCLT